MGGGSSVGAVAMAMAAARGAVAARPCPLRQEACALRGGLGGVGERGEGGGQGQEGGSQGLTFSPPPRTPPCCAQAPKPSAGPHKTRECLPLILLLRNRLK